MRSFVIPMLVNVAILPQMKKKEDNFMKFRMSKIPKLALAGFMALTTVFSNGIPITKAATYNFQKIISQDGTFLAQINMEMDPFFIWMVKRHFVSNQIKCPQQDQTIRSSQVILG